MSVSSFSKAAAAGLALVVGLSSFPEAAQAQGPALQPLHASIEPPSCKSYFSTLNKIEKNDRKTTAGISIGNVRDAVLSDLISGRNTAGHKAEQRARKAAAAQTANAGLRYNLSGYESSCRSERRSLVDFGACSILKSSGPLSNSEQRTARHCAPLRPLLGAAAAPAAPSAPGSLSNCQEATTADNKRIMVCEGSNGQKTILQLSR